MGTRFYDKLGGSSEEIYIYNYGLGIEATSSSVYVERKRQFSRKFSFIISRDSYIARDPYNIASFEAHADISSGKPITVLHGTSGISVLPAPVF
ncbi:MAG: hypothetical protein ACP5MH_11345 [Thermoproteus sp.]